MKKKILLVFVLVLTVFLTGCEKNNKNEQTDGYKFAEEYTSINGLETKSGKINRTLEISSDNPFVYQTAEEIVDRINNEETFAVYFGFATCPWCRSILPSLIDVSENLAIDTIYYVDISNIRDTKELAEDGTIKTTKNGSTGYMELLTLLNDVLEDYTLTNNDEEISAGEKRIYAPNVIAVSKGKAIQLETGISEELTDPYGELTDSIKEYAKDKFTCLLKCIQKESTTCKKNAC